MPNLPHNKREGETAAGQNKATPALPFFGKWAGVLFLIMLVITVATAMAEFALSCDSSAGCASFGKSGRIPVWLAVLWGGAGGIVLLWFVASFVWRWARTLPFSGKWAFLALLGIAGLESVLSYFWQGYADTAFGKITDKIFWVLILWLAAALRGKAIKEWLAGVITKAIQVPVNAAKETIGGAVQAVKSTAEESVGKITKGFTDAAGAVKETADKSVDKITEGLDKTTEAVKGTADTIADSAKSVGQKISSAGSEVFDTAASAGQAIVKVPGRVASAIKEGATSAGQRIKEKLPSRTPQESDKDDKS
ncbi:MAG: hypothetical protein ACR2P4_01230 [Gammaproteobacteria bacterium]